MVETAPTAGLSQPAAVLDAWQHAVAAIPAATNLPAADWWGYRAGRAVWRAI